MCAVDFKISGKLVPNAQRKSTRTLVNLDPFCQLVTDFGQLIPDL